MHPNLGAYRNAETKESGGQKRKTGKKKQKQKKKTKANAERGQGPWPWRCMYADMGKCRCEFEQMAVPQHMQAATRY